MTDNTEKGEPGGPASPEPIGDRGPMANPGPAGAGADMEQTSRFEFPVDSTDRMPADLAPQPPGLPSALSNRPPEAPSFTASNPSTPQNRSGGVLGPPPAGAEAGGLAAGGVIGPAASGADAGGAAGVIGPPPAGSGAGAGVPAGVIGPAGAGVIGPPPAGSGAGGSVVAGAGATAGAVGQPAPSSPPAGPSGGNQIPPSVRSAGWSPLGATPSAPPSMSGPPSSQNGQYLPPVAPPSAVSATETVTSTSGARWGWRALVAFLAGGLIAAGGFGAAQLDSSSEVSASESVPTTVVTTPPTVRDTGTVPLAPPDVDEPAAFVAQSLGPAVVQLETARGLGSGVVFGDGLILTNNHVIARAQSVRVKLADGRVLPGTVVGTDVNTDVGVVSVGPGQELPIAPLATGEKPTVGQVAIAIGSPFDLQQSVTAGIVSAVDRPVQNNPESVVAMIQTDAPINPGNSGGALADRRGRVIGINTSIQTDGLTAANVGVGFAIPIDTAIRIADLLVAGEPIEPGFLGVRGVDPPGGEAGVQLTEVTAGSAADLAGLEVGDRVLSLDDAPVTGFAELAGLVLANQAGDIVSLEVIRDEQLIVLDVTLGLREGN